MKKQLTLSLIFILSVFSYSYGEWENVSELNQVHPGRIAIDTDNNYMYHSDGLDIYQSTDNGESWNNLFSLETEYDDYAIIYIQVYQDIFFLITDRSSLYITRNMGNSFERVVLNKNNEDIYFLNYHNKIDFWNNHILLSTYYGIFVSDDLGKNWYYINVKEFNSNIFDIETTSDGVFALLYQEVYMSEDLENWELVSSLELNDKWKKYSFISDFNMGKMGNMVFLSVGPYLFKTIAQGHYLDYVSKFETKTVEGRDYDTIITRFASCDNILYATAYYSGQGSESAGLFCSADSGKTWKNLIPGIREPFNLAANNDYLFVSISWENGYSSFFRYELTDCIVDEVMGIEGEEMNGDDILLYQNNPNPFSDETEIMYYIPDNYSGSVRLIISDERGESIIKETEACFGRPCAITIDAGEFPTGVYVYAIEINGRIAASKKMIIIK